jgi:hypothetical protein
MLTSSRGLSVAICWFAVVALQPRALLAADAAAGPKNTTQVAPAEKPAQHKPAGCPHMEGGGSCCAECQGNAAQSPKGEAAAPMDCPCQHAKQAGKES